MRITRIESQFERCNPLITPPLSLQRIERANNLFLYASQQPTKSDMKIRDLIAKLSTYDPELPVTIANYEFGFDEIEEVSLIEVALSKVEDYYEPSDGQPQSCKRFVLCLGPTEPSLVN